MLFLNLHHHGFVVAEVFWGLWLFPLALLVYRSRFLPRFLGVWLAFAGFAWVILNPTGVLLPQSEPFKTEPEVDAAMDARIDVLANLGWVHKFTAAFDSRTLGWKSVRI
jgi:uncharacterized protein DUF4386